MSANALSVAIVVAVGLLSGLTIGLLLGFLLKKQRQRWKDMIVVEKRVNIALVILCSIIVIAGLALAFLI